MLRRTGFIILITLLVICSGCTGPATNTTVESKKQATTVPTTTTPPATQSAKPESPEVYVLNGTLDFNATNTWNRTQALVNASAGAPLIVVEPTPDGARIDSLTVFIDSSNTDNQALLSHEFAHLLHFQNNPTPKVNSTGQQFAFKTYQEGLARTIERADTAEYTSSELENWTLPTSSPTDRYAWAHYVIGVDYAQWWLNQPQNRSFVNASYPQTAETVLHPNSSDEPTPLNVTTGPKATEIMDGKPDRIGEMGVRVTLWTRLDKISSITAASGWGNDRYLSFQTENESAALWVLRWDNAKEAQEAREAFLSYQSREHREYSAKYWEGGEAYLPPETFRSHFWYSNSNQDIGIETLDSDTLAIFVGDRNLVTNLQVCGNSTVVRINHSTGSANGTNC